MTSMPVTQRPSSAQIVQQGQLQETPIIQRSVNVPQQQINQIKNPKFASGSSIHKKSKFKSWFLLVLFGTFLIYFLDHADTCNLMVGTREMSSDKSSGKVGQNPEISCSNCSKTRITIERETSLTQSSLVGNMKKT